jgi:hypothetical protein
MVAIKPLSLAYLTTNNLGNIIKTLVHVFYFSSEFIGELQYPITRDIVLVPLNV